MSAHERRPLSGRLRGAADGLRSRLRPVGVEERITWILGSPRSGTTWLATLLASLTDAIVVDEPLIGSHLAVPSSAIIGLASPEDPLVYESNATREAYFFSDQTADAWQPALRTLLLRRFAAAERGRDSRTAPILVKEPNGALAAPLLLRTLPRSRLLFVIRDGRDVVDSMLDGVSDGWITATHGTALDTAEREQFIERRAVHWIRTVRAVESAYATHDAARRLQVSYEDLLSDTPGQVARILGWFGVERPPAVVADVVDRLSFDSLPAERTGRGRFARAASPGLWRVHFSDREQRRLTELLGPTLEEFGYA